MHEKEHSYQVHVRWTGNRGTGTSDYRAYGRDHVIEAAGKLPLQASADPAFRGDPARYNPEDLLVASLAACHMLWYLSLCAAAGVNVTDYEDDPVATMVEDAGGGGRFIDARLRPRVMLSAGADCGKALSLHEEAHRFCFIANSVTFPVLCEPTIIEGRKGRWLRRF